MRDDASSQTATLVAMARDLGRLLPASVRLVDDPYGAAFASPSLSRFVDRASQRLRPLAAMPVLSRLIFYMQVRTRVIDDALRAFLATGGKQLVILGAGFDCRALRLAELTGVRVFEVDHPATQARKRSTLGKLGARSPAEYVKWDFEARPMEDLPKVLHEAGLDLAAPVFTIWEGVTMYLTEPAIDASLRAIRAWSAPGSQLALTYFAKSTIDEPSLCTRALTAVLSTIGEPWRFGWKPDELPEYLAARRFTLVHDTAIADAARELLPQHLAVKVSEPGRRFALAAA